MRLSRSIQILLIGLVIIVLLFICNLTKIIEGFQSPYEQLIIKIREIMDKAGAYDRWVGYLYKNAPQNSKVLNDYKKRVFQPNCKFRDDWSTNPPPGMNIPTPAASANDANIAYRNFMKCLTAGNGLCIQQLANSRLRFMEPGCAFLNPPSPSSYSNNLSVGFN